MSSKIYLNFLLLILYCNTTFALEPRQILIIANADNPESVSIAHYYCVKRGVPPVNILKLRLGSKLSDSISRQAYDKRIAEPIRRKLFEPGFVAKIKCLLTTYGVPVKVAGRGPLTQQYDKLVRLKKMVAEIDQNKKAKLQSQIDQILGKETSASVDSELSMVLFENYELHRWKTNKLKDSQMFWDFKTLMVSRLDAPVSSIARNLIDKAMIAEKNGLAGSACFDSRGLADDGKKYTLAYFDKSISELAELTRKKTTLQVKEEKTSALFEPNSCPNVAVYCGWYSLKKYVDAFTFVNGAVGYHIASLEAIDLHNPKSPRWCPAMLMDGITATLGAVDEPYVVAFPQPKQFFGELYKGSCLVEAYYRTKPFNSWQMILIGDPLYRPFKKSKFGMRK
jgi:uncharacterized protein (TIGR03790 family)